MNRGAVIDIAESQGWRRFGGFRRYGPDWYECFRRGNQFIWIGFKTVCGAPDDVRTGFHQEPLDYSNGVLRSQVREWLE